MRSKALRIWAFQPTMVTWYALYVKVLTVDDVRCGECLRGAIGCSVRVLTGVLPAITWIWIWQTLDCHESTFKAIILYIIEKNYVYVDCFCLVAILIYKYNSIYSASGISITRNILDQNMLVPHFRHQLHQIAQKSISSRPIWIHAQNEHHIRQII